MPSVLYACGDRRSTIPVYLQCGACGFTFSINDRIVALRGTNQSVVVQTRDVGGFPSTSYCDRGDSLSLQRSWYAYPRDSGTEYATIHEDCFSLYNQECQSPDKLRRLWVAACWRRPWFEAEPLNLPPNIDVLAAMGLAADICNLPQIHTLPFEVTEMIWDHSTAINLWRYSSVLDLAKALSGEKQVEQVSMPICDVSSWHRGSSPVVEKYTAEPFVRLTIDAQGLKQIERLSKLPSVCKFRSDGMVYIVRPLRELSGVTALFKLGLGRLGGSMKTIPNYTWDTPTPPLLQDCLPYTRSVPSISRFATVDTSRCTGITFFISSYRINAIHAHTPESPTALATWKRLMHHNHREILWIYLPLSRDDYITAFGLRMKMFAGRAMTSIPCFLARMSKSGDIALGPCHEDSTEDFVLSTEGRPTLIHNVSELDPMSIFGVYPGRQKDTTINPRRPSERLFHFNACFSSASLQEVTQIEMYYDKDTNLCRGILAEYEGGGRRVLGQCRIGVDAVQTTTRPKWFCFYEHHQPNEPDVPRTTEVQCTADSHHTHDIPGWKCHEMNGTLECWVFGENTALKIVTTT